MRSPSNPAEASGARRSACRRLVHATVLTASIAGLAACDFEWDTTGLGSTAGTGTLALDVQGVVRSATDGSPVGGASVSLCMTGFLEFSSCRTPVVTGADGRFQLAESVESRWCSVYLSVSATGFLGTQRNVACAGGAQILTVDLEPLSSMRVRVWPAPLRLAVGETVQLSGWVTTRTGGYVSDRVTWSTSATDVASVSESGLVTGVARGTAVITAEGGVQPGSVSVTVTESSAPASGPVAYVSASNMGAGGTGVVRVIDVATGAVVGSPIALGVGNIAVSPDRKWIYLTTGTDLTVLDAATNAVVVPSIPTGAGTMRMAIAPNGQRAYLTHPEANSISVIDLTARSVVKAIRTRDGPAGIVIAPDGKRGYVAHYRSLDVSVIDLDGDTLMGAPIPMGTRPQGLAITPDGARVLASILFGGSVWVIDVATSKTVGSFAVGTYPDQVVITPDGKRAYVMNSGSNDVWVIDLAKNEVIASIPIGSAPWSAAVTPDGATVFVACSAGDVLRIDVATNKLVGGPIRVGFSASALAIRP